MLLFPRELLLSGVAYMYPHDEFTPNTHVNKETKANTHTHTHTYTHTHTHTHIPPHSRHEQELSELEQAYRHEAYRERYQQLVRENRSLRERLHVVSESVGELSGCEVVQVCTYHSSLSSLSSFHPSPPFLLSSFESMEMFSKTY